jgi:hypothetical protein
LSTLNYWDSRFPIFTIKRFEQQEKVKMKIGSGKKTALSSSKVRAALRKQTAGSSAKAYRELKRKIQVHHNTVITTKVFYKDG